MHLFSNVIERFFDIDCYVQNSSHDNLATKLPPYDIHKFITYVLP